MSVRKRQWTTARGEIKEAWIVTYTDQRGVRVQETFERKKDADAHHDTVRIGVRKGTHIAPSQSPTVAQAADTWLKDVRARNAERSTIELIAGSPRRAWNRANAPARSVDSTTAA